MGQCHGYVIHQSPHHQGGARNPIVLKEASLIISWMEKLSSDLFCPHPWSEQLEGRLLQSSLPIPRGISLSPQHLQSDISKMVDSTSLS